MKKKASIGDIWITLIPKLLIDEDSDTIQVILEKRPCLIVDDGRGFLIEENSNYSGLKLTTRNSRLNKVNRKEIKNWKELGLKKKSYIRVELPIKIEAQQLVNKVTTLSPEDLKIYLKELVDYFNIDMLEKIGEEDTNRETIKS